MAQAGCPIEVIVMFPQPTNHLDRAFFFPVNRSRYPPPWRAPQRTPLVSKSPTALRPVLSSLHPHLKFDQRPHSFNICSTASLPSGSRLARLPVWVKLIPAPFHLLLVFSMIFFFFFFPWCGSGCVTGILIGFSLLCHPGRKPYPLFLVPR